MIGTATTITHAPSPNLVMPKMMATTNETTPPKPLIDQPLLPAALAKAQVTLGHAGLRQRERREHADRVQRDEALDLGAGDDQQHDRGDRQGDDAVAEHEAVAALGQLAGQEAVGRLERRQPREVGEAGVGGEDEDERRRRLQRVEQHVADHAVAEHEATDLGDDRRRAVLERRHVHLGGQRR